MSVTGTPQIELDIGGTPKLAACALASDTTMLVCTYTIAEGDEDTDGIAIGANKIALTGAVITLGGDAVTPTHPAIDADSGHKVDGIRPTVTEATSSADGTTVVLTFDAALSATTAVPGAFTVTVATANLESATTPSAVAVSDKNVTLTLATAIKAGQSITVDYDDPSTADDANAVQKAGGNDAASFAGQAVTNIVPEDGTAAGLSVSLSSATVTEGGDAVTVTVTSAAGATFASDRSITLAWGGEVLASNAGLIREPRGHSRVLIAAGESTGTANLVGVERAAYTIARTETLTAAFDDADATAIGAGLDLTYMDSGAAPAASIAAAAAMVPEGDDITVEVTLTRAFDSDVAVTFTMTDTENVVSTTAPATIAIAANETTGTVTLSTSADMMTGADAVVVFALDAITNEPYTLGTPATVTVTVLDDTSASDAITLSVTPVAVDEDAGATTLTVTATLNRGTLTTATDVALSVTAGTATETTDYTASAATTLTIAANAQSGTTPLTLTPVPDSDIEADETVTVDGTATGFTITGTEVSILDADEPAITLSFVGVSANGLFVEEGFGEVPITLKAVAAVAPTRDVVVRVHAVEREGNASVETGDFKPFDKIYSFAMAGFMSEADGWVQTVTENLELIDDLTVEKLETVDIQVDSAALARHVAAPENVNVLITDDDMATVGFAAKSYRVDEGDSVVLKIVASAPIAFPWSVNLTTVDLDGFTLAQIATDQQAALTAELEKVKAYATANDDYVHQYNPTTTEAFETNEVTVQTIEDVLDDDEEALLVEMVSNGLPMNITINPGYSFITITDDDELPGAPTLLTVDNAGPTTVTLSWIAPSDDGGNPITTYLVERSTDSDTAQRPTGTGPPPYTDHDLTPETTYHYRVSAITETGRGEPSAPVSATTAALPVITIAVNEDTHGNPLTPVTEGEAALFTVTFTGNTAELTEVNARITPNGDFLFSGQTEARDFTASFVPGRTSTEFIQATSDDAIDEADGSVTVTLQTGSGYTIGTPSSATVTIEDNDEVPGTPVLSARPDDEQVELTWPKPASGTSEITRYDYRSKEASAATWSDWTDTGVDLALTEFSLTIENLANGTPYSFELRALSAAGESATSTTVTATPSTGPTITGIDILSMPSLCDGRAYAHADEVQIGVTFSEAVSVDETDGQPYLSLRMEGYDADAPYKEGSGTTQLVFAKTFSDTDHSGLRKSFAIDDPGVHSTRGLQLNGGTIRSSTSMANAVLTGTSLGRTDDAHMIGVVMTDVSLTSSPAAGDTYANGERLTLTADFNAPIGAGTPNGGNSKLVLAFDSGRQEAEYSHFISDKVHYGYTITDSDADANGVGIPKDALKLNGAQFGRQGAGFNFVPCNEAIEMLSSDTVDGIRPTLVTTAPDAPTTSADGTQIVLTFDEALSATTAGTGDFEVTVSAMERTVTAVEVDADDNTLLKLTLGSAVAMMDTITVSYTDPSTDNDTNAVQDSVGNDLLTFAGQSVANNAPAGVTISSVTLSSSAGTDKTYAIDDPVTAKVTFSEAVTVTGAPQLTINVGGTDKTLSYSSGSGSTDLVFSGYMVAAGDTDTDGIAIEANKLSLNGATLTKTSAEPGGVVLAHTALAADSNHMVDGVAPTLVITGGSAPHASSDRSKIILTFNETIATVDSTKITVKSGMTDLLTTTHSNSGITVEITLTTALTMSATDITVTLAEDAVTDGAGNGIAPVGPIAVSLADTTAPTLTGSGTNLTTQILLVYDEPLDSASIPDKAQFAVTVGGASRTVSTVSLLIPKTIVLTLSSAFAYGDTLTVTYTVPALNPIRDAAENEAAAFATGTGGVTAVVNNVPPPPPEITSIEFTSEPGSDRPYAIGNVIETTVTFNDPVDITGTPQLELALGTGKQASCAAATDTTTLVCSYTVVENDNAADGLSIEANKLTLNGGTITAAGYPSIDANLAHSETQPDLGHKVDGVRPTLVTTGGHDPQTNTDGRQIFLTFNEGLSAADPAKLTVKSGTTTLPLEDADVLSVLSDLVVVTLTTALTPSSAALTIALAADAVVDLSGNGNAVTAAATVRNRVTAAPGAPVLTAKAADESIALEWTVADHGTSDITRFEYHIKETSGGTYSDWADTGATASNTGGSATIESLTNGTGYTVQIRGVSAHGEGAESNEPTATPKAPPMITSVEITSDPLADKTYAIGEDIVVTVTFDKDITLSTGTRNPYIQLRIGADTIEQECLIGTDTKTLVCTYTIEENEVYEDTDGIAIGQNLAVLTKLVVGPLGQTADTTFTALPDNANHKVDAVKPTPTGASADGTTLTLVWSELLNAGSTPAGSAFTVSVSSGTAPTVDSVAISEKTVTLTLSSMVDVSRTYMLAYAVPMTNPIEDAVGNPAVGFSGADRSRRSS